MISKNCLKKQNQLESKNQSESKNQPEFKFVFLQTLKVKKKTLTMNSLHQMKLFDTNIVHFCYLN